MNARTKIWGVLLLSCSFVAAAFSQEKEWTVADYLRELPAQYQTYSGDFAKEPTAERTIKDLRNGYIAYLDKAPDPKSNFPAYPVFEIALFKRANGDALVVVANTISDPVCTKHEAFFLRKRGQDWKDVRAEVLPKFTAAMFFKDPRLGPKFEAVNKEVGNVESVAGWGYLHFSLPRAGTRMKVTLDICDYVPDEKPELSFEEFKEKQKTVWLKWDKQKGIFLRSE